MSVVRAKFLKQAIQVLKLIPVGLALSLASCSSRSIESTRIDASDNEIYGLSYSLPRGYINVGVKSDGQKSNHRTRWCNNSARY